MGSNHGTIVSGLCCSDLLKSEEQRLSNWSKATSFILHIPTKGFSRLKVVLHFSGRILQHILAEKESNFPHFEVLTFFRGRHDWCKFHVGPGQVECVNEVEEGF